jgi:hypothetical protein
MRACQILAAVSFENLQKCAIIILLIRRFTMKIVKLSLVVLALTPVQLLACPAHEKTAASCMQGMVWDSETERCVDQISS